MALLALFVNKLRAVVPNVAVMSESKNSIPDVVDLNVGGRHFTTSLMTLTKCKETMLSAMFSGDYEMKKDKDGRFFIDADGDTFVYVLNYLRYGELPPVDKVNTVYRDAVYFGLHGLVTELERFPSILSKIQRDKYRLQFPGYTNAITKIIDCISETENKKTVDMTSNVVVILFAQEQKPKFPNFDKNHTCFFKNKNKTISADVSVGPWDHDIPEKEVMNCMSFDLSENGFVLTHDNIGQCNYMCEKPEDFPGRQYLEVCTNNLYKLTFHWWKM